MTLTSKAQDAAFAVDHGKWLDEILASRDETDTDLSLDPPHTARYLRDVTELIAGVKELITAGVPCRGYSYGMTDFVLNRFTRHSGWLLDDERKPSAIRELFGLYVKHGYICLGEPVNRDAMPAWMKLDACPLEYAILKGLDAKDTAVALIEEGADLQAVLDRRGVKTLDELGNFIFKAIDKAEMVAAVQEALMKRAIGAARASPDSLDEQAFESPAPRRRAMRL